MEQIVIIVHIIVAIMVIGLVLVQHGKGADVGASFGSGSSNTMFGSQGSMPFLMKITGYLAVIFFSTNLILSYIAGHSTLPSNSAFNISATPGKITKPAQQEIVFPSVNDNRNRK